MKKTQRGQLKINEITVTSASCEKKKQKKNSEDLGQDVVDLLLLTNYIQSFCDEDQAGNPAKSF